MDIKTKEMDELIQEIIDWKNQEAFKGGVKNEGGAYEKDNPVEFTDIGDGL